MKAVTSNQMKEIENLAMRSLGIDSIILMENAAIGVYNECIDFLKDKKNKNAVVFCGKGNNGGDGLAVARLLFLSNINVSIVLITDMENATIDCIKNFNIAKKLDIPIIYYSDETKPEIEKLILSASLSVDALIGTGLKSSLKPDYISLISLINKSAYIVAIDCPTGLNSDTGEVHEAIVDADKTIAFHLPKIGHLLSKTKNLIIKPISIPYNNENLSGISYNTLTNEDAKSLLPKRSDFSHKGSYGKLFLFSGCKEMTGAAVLNAKSAYTVGCGLVNACVVDEVGRILHSTLPEAVTTILSDDNGFFCPKSFEQIKYNLKNANIIAVGSGIGRSASSDDFVYTLIENASCPIIIDADGLNAVAKNIEVLSRIKVPCVITPHLKEMERLTGISSKEISKNKIEIALNFSKKYNVITVLKDAVSIIADPNEVVYINTSGCNAMAKAGSGDCLTGSIAGFASQGLSLLDSAILGTYVNGKAGEISSEALGDYSVLASNIIECIPKAFYSIRNTN